MLVTVHMGSPDADTAMARAVDRWARLVRVEVKVDVLPQGGEPPEDASVLFWDLDGGGVPPSSFTGGSQDGKALLLCASDPGLAIGSYALHPAGFLQKPLTLGLVKRALDRCAGCWWEDLERVDVLCCGLKRRVPLYDVTWVESCQHGSLLHTRHEGIQTRESLRDLEARLPEGSFIRCQRSFLVNLCHVRGLSREGITLDDSSQVPVSRAIRDDVRETLRTLRSSLDQEISV